MTQMRLFDGEAVASVSGKFSGAFDVADEDAGELAFGSTVVLVLVGAVEGVSFAADSTGDMKRINKLAVKSARVAKGPLSEELVDMFGLTNYQLQFPSVPAGVPTAPPGASTPVQSSSPVAPTPQSTPSTPIQTSGDPALDEFLNESVSP